MMKKRSVILYAILLILLCSMKKKYIGDQLMYKAIDEFSSSQKINGLYLIGSGGSIPEDKIRKFDLDFESCEKLDIEHARKRFVNTVEQFLKKVNSNQIIRGELENYPITIRNVSMGISFKDNYGRRQAPPAIAYVFLGKENIFYCSYDFANRELKDVYEEPYVEALRKVQDQNLKLK